MSLNLKNLTVFYEKTQILHAVDLEIPSGGLFAILGPSGCGKSTLLKTIAGLLRQKSGSIYLNNTAMDDVPAHKRGISMVFQDLRLFPHMTVLQNVAYPLKITGVKKAARLVQACEMLAQVQLQEYKNHRPSQLSGGQQQRVVLARALVARPQVLLLDEPFSSLDASLKTDMQTLVWKLQQKYKTTTVLVTHDFQEALKLADGMAVMGGGRILQHGTAKSIYENPKTPAVAEYFIKGNRVRGTVQNGCFTAPGIVLAAEKPCGEYTAYFKPEALLARPSGNGAFTVVRTEYLGEYFLIHVRHNHQPLELAIKTTHSLQAGQQVEITSINNDVWLFSV